MEAVALGEQRQTRIFDPLPVYEARSLPGEKISIVRALKNSDTPNALLQVAAWTFPVAKRTFLR
jgi:hypothetical protein